MSRPLRVQAENAVYHVNSVGVRRSVLFPETKANEMFLAILDVAVSRYHCRCFSYCLMGTHYHLLVQTPEANIARGMQFLNGVYAQWFNLTYAERGHVFMSRYYDVLVEDEDQLYRAFRYIALNPVEAGLCRAPGDWPWSSYAALVGDARPLRLLDTEFLLRPLSEHPQRGREALRKMVEDLDWPDWTPPGEARLAPPSNGLVTGSDPASAPLQV